MKKLALLSIGIAAFVLQNVSAQSLFTTTNDFTGWSGNNGNSGVATTDFDYDGVTINGAGNNPGNSGSTLFAGQAGTGGSLQLTWSGTPGDNFDAMTFSPGEGFNPFFMHTIDPGSLAAFTAESGFGSGTTVAYSGIINMIYSVPDNEGGTFFELGVDLSYDGDGFFSQFFPNSIVDTGTQDPNGNEVMSVTIPYTINAGSFNGFGFAILYNSNFSPLESFYVDGISVTPAPEPGTMALVGLSALGFGLISRRRRS